MIGEPLRVEADFGFRIPPDERADHRLFDPHRGGGTADELPYRPDRFGNPVKAGEVDYNGQGAAYASDPQESINYVAAHDNETLFDAVQLKAPLGTSTADRVRVQTMANALIALGQGVPFFHAGSDMLRSKSMDRDSYNSGDWFNALDFTYERNGWGIGLPVADKNQDKWPIMAPLTSENTPVTAAIFANSLGGGKRSSNLPLAFACPML